MDRECLLKDVCIKGTVHTQTENQRTETQRWSSGDGPGQANAWWKGVHSSLGPQVVCHLPVDLMDTLGEASQGVSILESGEEEVEVDGGLIH